MNDVFSVDLAIIPNSYKLGKKIFSNYSDVDKKYLHITYICTYHIIKGARIWSTNKLSYKDILDSNFKQCYQTYLKHLFRKIV